MKLRGKVISRPYQTRRHTAFIIQYKDMILPCLYRGCVQINPGETVEIQGKSRERGTWQEFIVQKLTTF